MSLTWYHHAGEDTIPRTWRHAVMHTKALQELRLSPKNPARQARTAWCDALHLELLLASVPHVVERLEMTEEIQQIWVMEPKAVMEQVTRDDLVQRG